MIKSYKNTNKICIDSDTSSISSDNDSQVSEEDKILLEDDTGHAIILNAAEEQYFLSAINETAGSDGAVHVEIVAQGNSIWHRQ